MFDILSRLSFLLGVAFAVHPGKTPEIFLPAQAPAGCGVASSMPSPAFPAGAPTMVELV